MFISVLFNIFYTYCKNCSLLFMLFGLQLTAARCPIASGTRDLSILFCCSLIGSSICSHRWINQGDYQDDVSLWFTAGSYPLGNTQLNQHVFFSYIYLSASTIHHRDFSSYQPWICWPMHLCSTYFFGHLPADYRGLRERLGCLFSDTKLCCFPLILTSQLDLCIYVWYHKRLPISLILQGFVATTDLMDFVWINLQWLL